MTSQDYIVYPGVRIEPNVSLGEFSVVGKPPRPLRQGAQNPGTQPPRPRQDTTVGCDTAVGTHVLIEEGAHIGRNCVIEAGAVIESCASIADDCFIVHGARVGADSSVGRGSVVGGFVAERSVLGEYCRVFGALVHRQLDPTGSWDAISEPGPVLGSYVFVGTGAVVIGPATLGTHVYVVACAIVTKDVPSYRIVHGTNRVADPASWQGGLPRSGFWRRDR